MSRGIIWAEKELLVVLDCSVLLQLSLKTCKILYTPSITLHVKWYDWWLEHWLAGWNWNSDHTTPGLWLFPWARMLKYWLVQGIYLNKLCHHQTVIPLQGCRYTQYYSDGLGTADEGDGDGCSGNGTSLSFLNQLESSNLLRTCISNVSKTWK